VEAPTAAVILVLRYARDFSENRFQYHLEIIMNGMVDVIRKLNYIHYS
jgi:hypothetical protein